MESPSRHIRNERVYLPLYRVSDAPFNWSQVQSDFDKFTSANISILGKKNITLYSACIIELCGSNRNVETIYYVLLRKQQFHLYIIVQSVLSIQILLSINSHKMYKLTQNVSNVRYYSKAVIMYNYRVF